MLEAPMTPLLRIQKISKQYTINGQVVNAVSNFSLDIHEGEVVGLAGESGCGKTTLGKMVVRLIEPTGGAIFYQNQNLMDLSHQQMRTCRRHLQIVLQDPYGSLNPRLTLENIIAEGLHIQGIKVEDLVEEAMAAVGLPVGLLKRLPNELSGGQRQRASIARALILKPRFLVFDESVSALDVSHQKQIIALLRQLKISHGLTYLFISHDLSLLQALADRIGVMYRGELVEIGKADELIGKPRHPYTQALISAIPISDPIKERMRRPLLQIGEPPHPTQKISGCQFHSRCAQAQPLCALEPPRLVDGVACHICRP